MRLRKLWLSNYRALQDVVIEFPDPREMDIGIPLPPIHLLLGVNGTGKTAVLRALASVFDALDGRRAPGISFELCYQVTRGREPVEVEITGDGRGTLSGVDFQVRQANQPPEALDPVDWPSYLPSQILVYTSGSLDEWCFLSADARDERSEEEERSELLRQVTEAGGEIQEVTGVRDLLDFVATRPVMEEVIPSRTRLFTDEDLELALLATLAIQEEQDVATQRGEIYRRAGVKRLRAFALRLEPLANRAQEGVILEQVDLLVRGLLQDRLEEDAGLKRRLDDLLTWTPPVLPAKLLDRVRQLARLATHRHRNSDGSYHLVFELDAETLLALGGSQGLFATSKQFFDFLADLRERGVLTQADMILEKTDLDEPILSRHLSDGEHEFLGRMALFLLMRQENTLFLLDEPEMHFNDVWKRELVDLLATTLEGFDSTVLLSTHSSIVVSDIAHPQLVLLVKDENGCARVEEVNMPTIGTDPSEIMMYLLNTDDSIGRRVFEQLDKLIQREWKPEERERLERLIRHLGPGYHRAELRSIWRELGALQD